MFCVVISHAHELKNIFVGIPLCYFIYYCKLICVGKMSKMTRGSVLRKPADFWNRQVIIFESYWQLYFLSQQPAGKTEKLWSVICAAWSVRVSHKNWYENLQSFCFKKSSELYLLSRVQSYIYYSEFRVIFIIQIQSYIYSELYLSIGILSPFFQSKLHWKCRNQRVASLTMKWGQIS